MVEHSCRPNAMTQWDAATGTMRLVAFCDIGPGDFISRSYVDSGILLSATAARQDVLQADWGFVCGCDRCAAALAETGHDEAAAPLLPGGTLDLQHCAEEAGLLVDGASAMAVQDAATASFSFGVPVI